MKSSLAKGAIALTLLALVPAATQADSRRLAEVIAHISRTPVNVEAPESDKIKTSGFVKVTSDENPGLVKKTEPDLFALHIITRINKLWDESGYQDPLASTESCTKLKTVYGMVKSAVSQEKVDLKTPAGLKKARQIADETTEKFLTENPPVRQQSWSEWAGFPIPYRTALVAVAGYAVPYLVEHGLPILNRTVMPYLGVPEVIVTPFARYAANAVWRMTLKWAAEYDGVRILNKLTTGKDTAFGMLGGGFASLPVFSMAADVFYLLGDLDLTKQLLVSVPMKGAQCRAAFQTAALLNEGVTSAVSTTICSNLEISSTNRLLQELTGFTRRADFLANKGMMADGLTWLGQIALRAVWR